MAEITGPAFAAVVPHTSDVGPPPSQANFNTITESRLIIYKACVLHRFFHNALALSSFRRRLSRLLCPHARNASDACPYYLTYLQSGVDIFLWQH